MRIISVANQKGGVGKTTTCIELADCLSLLGKKVLLIDSDQQANLSSYVGLSNQPITLSEILDGENTVEEGIIHVNRLEGNTVDIIPANGELSRADKKYTDVNDIYLFEDICKIAEEYGHYDYVIIDNSPSRNILLTMGYIAADNIIIPTECDSGAVSGILAVEEDISKLRDGRHPLSHATVSAILLTPYERTTMHKTADEMIRNIADTRIKSDTPPLVRHIRKSIKFSEVKAYRCSMQDKKYRSTTPAMDYRKLVADLVEMWEGAK